MIKLSSGAELRCTVHEGQSCEQSRLMQSRLLLTQHLLALAKYPPLHLG
ncbi:MULTISPECIES: hypothetical protein [unclassified Sulfitobacter]|nr:MULTISPECIES: hypothetical protein [unclassified Sulfitobacter]